MRITLNLATRPFADLGPALKRLRIAMAVLALAAIGLGLGLRALHQKAEAARAHDHSLDGQIAAVTKERKDYQAMMRRPENVQLLAQAAALNRLFDEKAFSWTLAMEDLETTLPGGVQVTSLEPIRDTKSGKITLHLRVAGPRNSDVVLVSNLEHSKRFLDPRIVNESAETASGPGLRMEPVSASNRFDFDLLAEYNPATPEERKAAKKAAPREEEPRAQIAPAAAPNPVSPALRPGRIPYTGPNTGQAAPGAPIQPNPAMRGRSRAPNQFIPKSGGPQ